VAVPRNHLSRFRKLPKCLYLGDLQSTATSPNFRIGVISGNGNGSFESLRPNTLKNGASAYNLKRALRLHHAKVR
jgi:hypothetical protein